LTKHYVKYFVKFISNLEIGNWNIDNYDISYAGSTQINHLGLQVQLAFRPLAPPDTNTVSYIIKGKSPASRARLAALQQDEAACISSITEAELLYGLAKSGGGDQRRKAIDWFLLRLKVLSWGREEAAAYGLLGAKQESMGKPLGPLDTQIAAHAVAVGAVVVTNDNAFRLVPDLVGVENWAINLPSI
jgi:tRNA(fMet)-specific endonuclease VapC